jgi:hypothetical protein
LAPEYQRLCVSESEKWKAESEVKERLRRDENRLCPQYFSLDAAR